MQNKKRSWRPLCRARWMISMMQYLLKLEEFKEGSCDYVLSGAIFVPVPNLGLLDLHACTLMCRAIVTSE